MKYITLIADLLVVLDCAESPEINATASTKVDTKCTDLAVYIPLTPAVYGDCSPFDDDLVPSTIDDTALTVCTPMTPAICEAHPPFGDDLVPYTAEALPFFGRFAQLMLWLKSKVKPIMLNLLDTGCFDIFDELFTHIFMQFMALLWSKLKAAIKDMTKMLSWFNVDLAPFRAKVQSFFNGQTNTMTSPSVVDDFHIYVEKRPPSAESRPTVSFEAGPSEPRSKLESLGLPQSHTEINSTYDRIQHGSSAMIPMPEPIDEHQLTGPTGVAIARAEQVSRTLQPTTNIKTSVYQWNLDEFAKTVIAYMSFPADIRNPKGFQNAVNFVRANKGNIEMQAAGLAYVGKIVNLVKQGVEELNAISVSKELSRMVRKLETVEAAFVKGCDIKQLTKKIEHIDRNYVEGGFKKWNDSQDYCMMVFKTARHITRVLKDNQANTKKFLHEVRGLCDTYNMNREWVLFMATP